MNDMFRYEKLKKKIVEKISKSRNSQKRKKSLQIIKYILDAEKDEFSKEEIVDLCTSVMNFYYYLSSYTNMGILTYEPAERKGYVKIHLNWALLDEE